MFDNQIANLLVSLNSQDTKKSYSRALIAFHGWYINTYAEEPSAELLTDVERSIAGVSFSTSRKKR